MICIKRVTLLAFSDQTLAHYAIQLIFLGIWLLCQMFVFFILNMKKMLLELSFYVWGK